MLLLFLSLLSFSLSISTLPSNSTLCPLCSYHGACSNFTCLCLPNWSGLTCDNFTDPCYNNTPCAHNANCTATNLPSSPPYNSSLSRSLTANSNAHNSTWNDTQHLGNVHWNATHQCNCSSNYTGMSCEFEICDPRQCYNHGQCAQHPVTSLAHCDCSPQYSGENCEDCLQCPDGTALSCSSTSCNHGYCEVTLLNHTCHCSIGYQGSYCDRDIDECTTHPSICNNGRCVNTIGSYYCNCQNTGFGGKNCEKEIFECELSPCQNGACSEVPGPGYHCSCASGWSGYTCGVHDCQKSGTCVHGDCERSPAPFTCTCDPGYEGEHCEQDIIECVGVTCQNGGTCQDRVNGYLCNCEQGYTGIHCEAQINYCASGPCIHGQCTSQLSGFSCDCSPGYTGLICATDINDCDPNPCLNGTCVDGENNYTCQCYSGYSGSTCNLNIDDCAGNPCGTQGVCSDLLNTFSCTCSLGYTGQLCETSINYCSSNNCSGHGNCIPSNCTLNPCTSSTDFFQCSCKPGYTGPLCGDDIDYCEHSHCSHGECIEESAGYHCVCYEGFSGQFCFVNESSCIGNECQNGTCIEAFPEYRCECLAGFEGEYCQAKIDYCLNVTCLNGTCVENGLSSSCVCYDGYLGDMCENIDLCNEQPCINGGNCSLNDTSSYSCLCPANHTGSLCESSLNSCAYIECSNNVSCVDVLGMGVCECSPGYTGQLCESKLEYCRSNPCQNNGTCIEGANGFNCTCSGHYVGDMCEIELTPCSPYWCTSDSNLMCVKSNIPNDSCFCPNNTRIFSCIGDGNVCNNSICRNGGVCGVFKNWTACICPDNYTGANCDLPTNPCLSDPCNNSSCVTINQTDYGCLCSSLYTGKFCESMVIPCGDTINCSLLGTKFCIRNSTTVTCQCHPAFSGDTCSTVLECPTGFCPPPTSCDVVNGSFVCVFSSTPHGSTPPSISQTPPYTSQTPPSTSQTPPSTNQTPPSTSQTPPSTNQTPPSTSQTPPYTNQTSPYTSQTPPSTSQTPPYTSQTPPSTNQTSPYTSQTPPYTSQTPSSTSQTPPYTSQTPPSTNQTSPSTNQTPPYTSQTPPSTNQTPPSTSQTPPYTSQTPPSTSQTPPYTSQTPPSTIPPTPFSPCTLHPCLHGNCTSIGVGEYSCECFPGFTGTDCDANIDYCSQVSCANGGTCKNGSDSAKCHCLPNFAGSLCLFKLTEPDYIFNRCSNKDCRYLFNDGQCDQLCAGAEDCLFDGLDCLERDACPAIDCESNFGNSLCNEECNKKECIFDGGDCFPDYLSDNRQFASGNLLITVQSPKSVFSFHVHVLPLILYRISMILNTMVVVDYVSEIDRTSSRVRRQLLNEYEYSYVIRSRVDNSLCEVYCFGTAAKAAEFLNEYLSNSSIDTDLFRVLQITSSEGIPSQTPVWQITVGVVIVSLIVFVSVVIGGLIIRKKRPRGIYFPRSILPGHNSSERARLVESRSVEEPAPPRFQSCSENPSKRSKKTVSRKVSKSLISPSCSPPPYEAFQHPQEYLPNCVFPPITKQFSCPQALEPRTSIELDLLMVDPSPGTKATPSLASVNAKGAGGYTSLSLAVIIGNPTVHHDLPFPALPEYQHESSFAASHPDTPHQPRSTGGMLGVEELIKLGADVNVPNDEGATPLHLAAKYKRSEIAVTLVDAGALVNKRDKLGRTPLHSAIVSGARDVLQILLANRYLNINLQSNDGLTALMLCVVHINNCLLKDLLQAHANVNLTDRQGYSALHWAASVNNVVALQTLIPCMADIDCQDSRGQTALFLAAKEGSLDCARVLLQEQANPHISDLLCQFPIIAASNNLHKDIEDLLSQFLLSADTSEVFKFDSSSISVVSKTKGISSSKSKNEPKRKKTRKISASKVHPTNPQSLHTPVNIKQEISSPSSQLYTPPSLHPLAVDYPADPHEYQSLNPISHLSHAHPFPTPPNLHNEGPKQVEIGSIFTETRYTTSFPSPESSDTTSPTCSKFDSGSKFTPNVGYPNHLLDVKPLSHQTQDPTFPVWDEPDWS